MTSAIPNSPHKPTVLPETCRRKHLSPAEQRVVELVATGLSTKEVAARLAKSTLRETDGVRLYISPKSQRTQDQADDVSSLDKAHGGAAPDE